MIDFVEIIQGWFASQCDGVWEHSFGIEVLNIDNPGCKLKINGASLKRAGFVSLERNESDWIRVTMTDMEFVGYGGTENLKELMSLAVNWLAIVDANSLPYRLDI